MSRPADADETVLRTLAVAMALQFAIGGAVNPFITVFFQDRGLDYTQISNIYLAGSSTLAIFPFLWGMWADRSLALDRVFTVMNGLALASLMAMAAQSTYTGLLLAFTGYVASFNPTLMLINPLCFHHLHHPRRQFGLLRSWGSLGWIVPSLPIYGWMIWTGRTDLNFVPYVGMVLAAAMMVFTFKLPHTPPGAAHAGPEGLNGHAHGYLPAMKKLFRDGNYVVLLAAYFLVGGSFSLLVFFSPARLVDLGMDRAWIGPVQCLGVMMEVVLFRWRSLFVHRLSYFSTILIGCLALVLRQVLFAWVDNLWILTMSYLLAGMVIVFFHIGVSVLVNSIAGRQVRSTAQTLMLLCGSSLGPMFSNGTAGFLTKHFGQNLKPVFLFSAVLAVLASALILWRGPRLDPGLEKG